eukprot:7556034-Alexandrium_andersonii.AAC.1
MEVLQSGDSFNDKSTHWCFRHLKDCRLYNDEITEEIYRLAEEDGGPPPLEMVVAGITCKDFSAKGLQLGMKGPSTK